MSDAPPTELPPSGWYVDPDGDSDRLRYWDGERWTDRRTEANSKHHRVSGDPGPFLTLSTVSRLAIGGMVALIAIEGFSLIDDLNRIALDQSFLNDGFVGRDEVEHADNLDTISGISLLVGYLLIGPLTFIPWFHRAYSNLARLGFHELRYGPGWAIGSWFVPILNLFRPKQMANDIYRASDPAKPPRTNYWTEPITPLLGWWWGLFVSAGFVEQIGTRLAIDANEDDFIRANGAMDSVRQEQTGLIITSVGNVMMIIAAVLAIRVVLLLTERQEEAARARAMAAVETM
jgi:uncharacterized protein DUF4328/uncharacterized protein DUF2510